MDHFVGVITRTSLTQLIESYERQYAQICRGLGLEEQDGFMEKCAIEAIRDERASFAQRVNRKRNGTLTFVDQRARFDYYTFTSHAELSTIESTIKNGGHTATIKTQDADTYDVYVPLNEMRECVKARCDTELAIARRGLGMALWDPRRLAWAVYYGTRHNVYRLFETLLLVALVVWANQAFPSLHIDRVANEWLKRGTALWGAMTLFTGSLLESEPSLQQ